MPANGEGAARFVVLWGVDAAAVLAARDAYVEHVARCGMPERRDFFTVVHGGRGYGVPPRESELLPLTRIVACADSADTSEWTLFLPAGDWWERHGAAFLAARPHVRADAVRGGPAGP